MFEFFRRIIQNSNEGKDRFSSSEGLSSGDDVTVNAESNSKTSFRVASCQSVGKTRSHNEDSLFTLNSHLEGFDSPLAFGLYLVADGMGGHQSGELASSLAAQATSQYIIDKVFNSYLFDRQDFSDTSLKQYLKEAVAAAQELLLHRVPGGGTTLTFVLILGERFFFTHVGDSRLYKIDQFGKMTLQTKDHSLVKRLIDLGEITENEARVHPQRNVLYRALGQSEYFEPDIGQFSLARGERFMICSDGLWGVLSQEQMMEIIKPPTAGIEQIACDLVDAANEMGGPDNISLVLVEKLI